MHWEYWDVVNGNYDRIKLFKFYSYKTDRCNYLILRIIIMFMLKVNLKIKFKFALIVEDYCKYFKKSF